MKIITLFLILSISLNAQNFKQVNDFLEQGNYQLALNLLENTKNKSFKNLEKTAIIYQKIGNYGSAISNFEKALQIQFSITTKENLGKAYQNYGNIHKAIKVFEEVLIKNKFNFLLKYQLAKLFLNNKQYHKAKFFFNELILNDANNPNYYFYLGRVFEELEERNTAKKQFLKAIATDSLHLKSYYKLAKIFRKEKNKDSTVIYVKKGLKINANYVALLQLNSKVAYKNKNYHAVIKSVKKLDSLKASSKLYKHLQAFSYYHTFQYKEAEKNLSQILFSKQANEKTLFYLGLAHRALENYDQANYYFLLSIQQQTPNLSQHYYYLGEIATKTNKPKIAINYLKKSLKERSYNAKALYMLATLSEDYYKDKKIALELYKKYLNKFEGHNIQKALYVKQQIKKITTDLFMHKE